MTLTDAYIDGQQRKIATVRGNPIIKGTDAHYAFILNNSTDAEIKKIHTDAGSDIDVFINYLKNSPYITPVGKELYLDALENNNHFYRLMNSILYDPSMSGPTNVRNLDRFLSTGGVSEFEKTLSAYATNPSHNADEAALRHVLTTGTLPAAGISPVAAGATPTATPTATPSRAQNAARIAAMSNEDFRSELAKINTLLKGAPDDFLDALKNAIGTHEGTYEFLLDNTDLIRGYFDDIAAERKNLIDADSKTVVSAYIGSIDAQAKFLEGVQKAFEDISGPVSSGNTQEQLLKDRLKAAKDASIILMQEYAALDSEEAIQKLWRDDSAISKGVRNAVSSGINRNMNEISMGLLLLNSGGEGAGAMLNGALDQVSKGILESDLSAAEKMQALQMMGFVREGVVEGMGKIFNLVGAAVTEFGPAYGIAELERVAGPTQAALIMGQAGISPTHRPADSPTVNGLIHPDLAEEALNDPAVMANLKKVISSARNAGLHNEQGVANAFHAGGTNFATLSQSRIDGTISNLKTRMAGPPPLSQDMALIQMVSLDQALAYYNRIAPAAGGGTPPPGAAEWMSKVEEEITAGRPIPSEIQDAYDFMKKSNFEYWDPAMLNDAIPKNDLLLIRGDAMILANADHDAVDTPGAITVADAGANFSNAAALPPPYPGTHTGVEFAMAASDIAMTPAEVRQEHARGLAHQANGRSLSMTG